MFIYKFDDIVIKYNNKYHSTIKMKPFDVKSSTYIHSSKEFNNKVPKFKIGDFVRISKYKNIFPKGYVPNWSEEVFAIEKFKNTVAWIYFISDVIDEAIAGTFYEKELEKNKSKRV